MEPAGCAPTWLLLGLRLPPERELPPLLLEELPFSPSMSQLRSRDSGRLRRALGKSSAGWERRTCHEESGCGRRGSTTRRAHSTRGREPTAPEGARH